MARPSGGADARVYSTVSTSANPITVGNRITSRLPRMRRGSRVLGIGRGGTFE